ncbi:MAG TPA: aryl-sulfate sulfotransferase [Chitinophagales bacterium]|nr:aryl-sulfate sulfotransferase [Chitinophagales bacterium]
MGKLFTALFITAGFTLAGTSFSNAQFQYVSPDPGSKLLDPNTTIILRCESLPDESSVHTKNIFTVKGSISGKHECEITLAEKGKTIILKPTKPFAGGETVTVDVAEELYTSTNEKIHSTSFNFEIRKARTAEENQLIAQQMQQLYSEEFGSGSPSSDMRTDGSGFPDFTVTTNTTPADGDVFFSNFNLFIGGREHYCIIKSNGDSVLGVADTVNYNNWDINRNGNLTLFNDHDSAFVMLDSNYRQIGEYQMGNGYKADPHEFVIYPNGNHYMLSYDPEIVDMTVYNPTYSSHATVIGCIIQELDSNNNVIFQWRSWDHYSILDGDHVIFSNAIIDYCHANAIEEDNDGNLLFSCRNMSEITKINRSTGDIMWRWGGLNNQFTFVGDPDKFSYQHNIKRIANGNVTLFDNGNYHSPSRSYAKEYVLDEVNHTATLTWSYNRAINGGHVFSRAMGSVQRLSNGNSFICWGLVQNQSGAPKLTEVTSSGTVVWELGFPTEDAVYRSHRYVWEPCVRVTPSTIYVDKITSTTAKIHWGVANNAASYDVQYRKLGKTKWKLKNTTALFKKLTGLLASTTYQYRIRTNCTSVPTAASGFTAIKTFTTAPLKEVLVVSNDQESFTLYPNPATNEVQLELDLDDAQTIFVSFYDVTGKIVLQRTEGVKAGDQSLQFDVSTFPAGIYIAEIKTADRKMVQKFVKE